MRVCRTVWHGFCVLLFILMLKMLQMSLFCRLMAFACAVGLAVPAQVLRAAADTVRVSLITIYPGSNEWSIFGHTELRVQQGADDEWYNYGLFDFSSPNFAWRFACGETDYMCGVIPGSVAMRGYGNRKVVSQLLNLTQDEAIEVRDMLRRNALPENATYRYKFLSDNCSTRPRDIIEQVLGGKLRFGAHGRSGQVTYRKMISHYAANYAWERFGIDLALGSSIDTAITWRQQMFIPMVLMQACGTATVSRNGRTLPLVAKTEVLNSGSNQGEVLPPTPRWQSPLTLSLLLLIVALLITWCDQRYVKVSRIVDALLSVAYSLAGCVVVFLVFFSSHESTSPNWVLLWLHPLYIIAALALFVPKAARMVRVFCWVSGAALVLSILVGLTGVQHFNAAFYPLILTALVREINYMVIYYRQRKFHSCPATRR